MIFIRFAISFYILPKRFENIEIKLEVLTIRKLVLYFKEKTDMHRISEKK